jgi:nucleoside 2-deoxyribosyltransferase
VKSVCVAVMSLLTLGNERKSYTREQNQGWWTKVPAAGFIRRDLEDIEKCDVLIAYLPRLSAGTCMELFYAKLKGKKTICICSLENPSPWIIVHSHTILKDIDELEAALKRDSK